MLMGDKKGLGVGKEECGGGRATTEIGTIEAFREKWSRKAK